MLIVVVALLFVFFFFFNDTATTEIYTLSLHDALPISSPRGAVGRAHRVRTGRRTAARHLGGTHLLYEDLRRSEEHTSELQSRLHLVCRLLLEKKKTELTATEAYLLHSQSLFSRSLVLQ